MTAFLHAPLVVAQVTDTTTIGFYLIYALAAIALVVYLARTLRRNGAVFLVDVFEEERLAEAVNQLLVIGFYLLNLGYAFLIYQLEPSGASLTEAFNQLVVNLGLLLLSLGVIHLLNMFVFWRIRTYRDRQDRRAESGYRYGLPLPPVPPPPPSAPGPVRPEPAS